MKKNILIKFLTFACLFAVLLSFGVCFAQDGEGVQAATELTKEQRLKNTIYLQDLNYAAAVDGVLTVINSEDKSIMPQMKDGKLYVPIRFVFESVGLKIGWNQEKKCVSVWLGEAEYRLFTQTSTFALGGFERKLDNDCFIQRGTTYVALEDVTNIITCQTHYFPEYHSAVIAFSEHEWIPERDAEIQAVSAMEFAISPFFKMFT